MKSEDECFVCDNRIGNEEYQQLEILRISKTINAGDDMITPETVWNHSATASDVGYAHTDCLENDMGEVVRKEKSNSTRDY